MPDSLHITNPPEAGARLADAVRALDANGPDVLRLEADAAAVVTAAAAALACGRTSGVRDLLRTLADEPRPPAGVRSVLLPLLLARYVAWTGSLGTALGVWPAVRDTADALLARTLAGGSGTPAPMPPTGLDDDDDDSATVLLAAACAGLERTATDLGDPRLAARVHPRARGLLAGLAERPLAGPAGLLAAALDLPGQPGAAGAAPDLRADAPPEQVLRAVHELLGVAADAPRHRVWLRPRRPRTGDRLEAGGIRMGDDVLSFAVEWRPDAVTATVSQDAGPIPLTLLLELFLPGPLRQALVDDRDAGLRPHQAGSGYLVQLQLVLDHPRRVELAL